MGKSDFHITKVMPDIKKASIIATEGVCPVCNSKNTVYTTHTRHNEMIIQNTYRCNDCTSEWKGNSYTQNFKRITSKEEALLENNKFSFLEGLTYLFSL